MVAVLGSLYFLLFRFPFTPVWSEFDQYGFILDASRIWRGEVIYRDFFSLTPPGIEAVHLAIFSVFGLRNWIPDFMVILTGVPLVWLTVFISGKVLSGRRFLAWLPAALFLAFGFLPSMQDSHRWFSSVAVMAALAVLMNERSVRRVAVAGALCGLTSFFTQTEGIFVVTGVVVFLIWEGYRAKSAPGVAIARIAVLTASFLVAGVVTYGYFVYQAGPDSVWDCLVRFPARYYPLDRENNSLAAYFTEFPPIPPLRNLFALRHYVLIQMILPLVCAVFAVWQWRRDLVKPEGARLMLICFVGLSLYASVAPTPSYFRLCTVSPPAIVLLIYWLGGEASWRRIAIWLLWIGALFATLNAIARVQNSAVTVLQLPRGPIAFSGNDSADYQLLSWLSEHTHEGGVFFAAGEPGIFFPLGLWPVSRVSGLDNTGYTRIEDVQNSIATLDRYRVKLIEWPPTSCNPEFYRPEEDHLKPLRDYVHSHYHMLKQFRSGDNSEVLEIWQRSE
jgi:hypothetical protein